MRNACIKAITKLAITNESIVVLMGDLGNQLFDEFIKVAAQRFYNCGIAEDNLTGVAAGMALMGFRPITFSIAPFVTVRCLEQIRVYVCYQNLPVIIVGNYAGFSYSELGPTHQSCDDIGLLRILPNMTILCPCDVVEISCALAEALNHDGPIYLRIGKKNEPIFHKKIPKFIIGKAITMKKGRDICILSTGNAMGLALSVAQKLESQAISVRVESFHTVKPLDTVTLDSIFTEFPLVVTIEEHSLIGGFGSAVAEWLVDSSSHSSARLIRFGVHDSFNTGIHFQESARLISSLNPEDIVHAIKLRICIL
jgi:transketolase